MNQHRNQNAGDHCKQSLNLDAGSAPLDAFALREIVFLCIKIFLHVFAELIKKSDETGLQLVLIGEKLTTSWCSVTDKSPGIFRATSFSSRVRKNALLPVNQPAVERVLVPE